MLYETLTAAQSDFDFDQGSHGQSAAVYFSAYDCQRRSIRNADFVSLLRKIYRNTFGANCFAHPLFQIKKRGKFNSPASK